MDDRDDRLAAARARLAREKGSRADDETDSGGRRRVPITRRGGSGP